MLSITPRYFVNSDWELTSPGRRDLPAPFTWDLEQGSFTASPEFYRLHDFELDPKVHTGTEAIHGFPPAKIGQERERKATYEYILGGAVAPTISRIVLADGSERVLMATARRVRDHAGRVVLLRGNARDISDDPKVTSVNIAARGALARAALRAAFEGVEFGRVVGENSNEALRDAGCPGADLLLTAIEDDDIELLARFRQARPDLPIMAVVDPEEPQLVSRVLEMKIDCVLTPTHLKETIPVALASLKAGGRFIGPALVERLIPSAPAACEEPRVVCDLSDVEREMLRMLASGMRNNEIASALFISLPSVKRYAQRIYEKIGARDRAHAAAIAQRLGVL